MSFILFPICSTMKKKEGRKRSLSQFLGDVDELIVTPPFQVAHSCFTETCTSIGGGSGCTSHVVTPSLGSFEVACRSESLATSELDLLRRKDEDLADMSLFLVEALFQLPSEKNFCELLSLFIASGHHSVLLAQRHATVEEKFIQLLFQVTLRHPVGDQCYLRFLSWLVRSSNKELFYQPVTVRFCVAALRRADELTSTTCTGALSRASAPLHWSDRGKASVKKGVSQVGCWKHAEELLDKLCGVNAGTPFSLILGILLDLIFAQNEKEDSATFNHSVPLLFVRMDGMQIVASYLQRGTDCAELLSFLEVLTASIRLPKVTELEAIAECLCKLLAGHQAKESAILRILTNVTGLYPSSLRDDSARQLGTYCRTVLLRDDVDNETATFAICCSVNIIRDLSTTFPFTTSLTACDSFIEKLTGRVLAHYNAGRTEETVLSGYYALLLAVLSLVPDEEDRFRVTVITAVAQVTKNTELGSICAGRPMTVIVAIIQEFLLFQSQSGTLTKSVLLAFNRIVKDLLDANGIEQA